jgi:adenylate cyclase
LKITTLLSKLGQRRRRRILHGALLILAGGLVALLLTIVQPFYTFNLWTADQFLGNGAPSPNIVIAGIDDPSLKTYGKWSEWSRDLHARAIGNLRQAGASVIAFDVLFADDARGDDQLAQAIGQSGNVVLAMAGSGTAVVRNGLLGFPDAVIPSDTLLRADPAIGHVNVVPDPDGKVRRLPLLVELGGETWPSLSLATLFTLFHQEIPADFPQKDGRLKLLSREIPLEGNGYLRLNYAPDPTKLPFISYGQIIRGDFDPSVVKNKIVLIGMAATGDVDNWSIPSSALRIPGIYLHATALDTILQNKFLSQTGTGNTLLVLVAFIIFAALVFPIFGTWYWKDVVKGAALTAFLLVAWAVICSLAADKGHILNVLYPSLLLVFLFVANLLYIVLREQADKQFVKGLFGRYVSPQVSREIIDLANQGELRLGGEERQATVLFADIRNFTTLSQKLSPPEVVGMLNSCLPLVIDSIVSNGGLVNKFAGDNLMGVWNAPKSQPGHAALAVKAAWEAQRKMDSFGAGDPNLGCVRFGMGINTGQTLAGNVGSSGRAEYTVIGDAVNLASRLCSSAAAGEILIGEGTLQQAGAAFQTDPLPPQIFKGMSKAVPVFRVTGPSGPHTGDQKEEK